MGLLSKFSASVFLIVPPLLAAVSSDSQWKAAEYYFEKHQYGESMRLCEEVVKRYPQSFEAQMKLADHYLLFKGRAITRAFVLNLLSSSSTHPERKRLLIEKLNAINSVFFTDDGQANFLQAKTRINLGELSRAQELLEAATLHEDQNTLVFIELAQIQRRLGQWKKLSGTLQHLLNNNPYEWSHRLELAEALIHENQPADALKILEAETRPHSQNPYQLALAVALYDSGNKTRARALFVDIVEHQMPVHPVVWYYLGKFSENSPSNHNEARLYYQYFRNSTRHLKPDASPSGPYRVTEKLKSLQEQLGTDGY